MELQQRLPLRCRYANNSIKVSLCLQGLRPFTGIKYRVDPRLALGCLQVVDKGINLFKNLIDRSKRGRIYCEQEAAKPAGLGPFSTSPWRVGPA